MRHWVKHFLCKITLICKIVQLISIFINYRVNWEQWYYSVDVTLMVKKHFHFFVLFWFVSYKSWSDSNLKRERSGKRELDMRFEEHTPVTWLLTSPHRFCSCSVVPHWGHKAIIQLVFRVYYRSNCSKMKTVIFYLRIPLHVNIKYVLC